MAADVIPHILMNWNLPGGLDYVLSDNVAVIPMPFPLGSQNCAIVNPYFNTAMMSFQLILVRVALL